MFVCRYALGVLRLKDDTFNFMEIKDSEKKLKDAIATSQAFDFGMDEIRQLRSEMRSLIEKLSKIYKETIPKKSYEKNVKVDHDVNNTSKHEATHESDINAGDNLKNLNVSSDNVTDTNIKKELNMPSPQQGNCETHGESDVGKNQIAKDSCKKDVKNSAMIEGQSSQNPDKTDSLYQSDTSEAPLDRMAMDVSTQTTKSEKDISLGIKDGRPQSNTDTYNV